MQNVLAYSIKSHQPEWTQKETYYIIGVSFPTTSKKCLQVSKLNKKDLKCDQVQNSKKLQMFCHLVKQSWIMYKYFTGCHCSDVLYDKTDSLGYIE